MRSTQSSPRSSGRRSARTASAVLARVWENTAKVALIKAVSASPQAPVIRPEDADWAKLVVDRCVTTLITEAERHIADNQTQANHLKDPAADPGCRRVGLSRNEITAAPSSSTAASAKISFRRWSRGATSSWRFGRLSADPLRSTEQCTPEDPNSVNVRKASIDAIRLLTCGNT